MGDLKKKKIDFIIKNEHDENEFQITNEGDEGDEQALKLLRIYMQKFYELQIEKRNRREGSGEGGKVSDVQKRNNRS